MTTFGNKLAMWMDENNVTVKELAEKCDVTRQSVKKWINGGNMFNKYRIKIKAITGIDFDNPHEFNSEVKFITCELVAVKSAGCSGCIFSKSSDYENVTCGFFAERITGMMCSKDHVIFKLKEQWAPCPITVEEGETVRNATSKLTFEVVSSPITFGTKYRGKMIVKNEHGDELMVNHADFEVEA